MHTLAELVDSYRPRSATEAADLARLRSLLDGDPWGRDTPVHVTASALVVDAASHDVLLRWHERQQAWIQVGGHADPGETDPLVVAQREAREETGLDDLTPWPGHCGPVHVVTVPVPANATEPDHEHVDVRYVLATDRPTLARPEHDRAPLRWLSFAAAHQLTGQDNVRTTLTRAETLLLPG